MKILIELPTWLGDCVMVSPAIDHITSEYPDANFYFIGSDISINLMKEHPLCKSAEVLHKELINIYRFAKLNSRPDLFISFRSSIRTVILNFLLGSFRFFQYQPYRYKKGHQVEKYVQFINDSLKIKKLAGELNIYKRKSEKKLSNNIGIGLNPGASYGIAKCWPEDKFVEVAIVLSRKADIFIFGGPNDVDISNRIEKRVKKNGVTNVVNYAGETSIDDLCYLISGLDLFITGDSGPMHIASYYKVPTITIFGPTKDSDTNQWKNPYSKIIKQNLSCQPCMKRVCPLGHNNCMKGISSKKVAELALSLI